MNKFAKVAAGLFVMLLSVSALGCSSGGSGDSSGSTAAPEIALIEYAGQTSAAEIEEENVSTYVNVAVEMVSMGQESGGMLSYSRSNELIESKPLTDIIKNSLMKAAYEDTFKINRLRAASRVETGRENGPYGGYYAWAAIDNEDGTGVIKMTYYDYKDTPSMAFSGVMRMTFNYDEYDEIVMASATFYNLDMYGDEDDTTLAGIVSVDFNSSYNRIVLDLVVRDNLAAHHVKCQNFVVQETSYNSYTIEGRIYDSDFGYVVYSTPVDIVQYSYASYPSEGEVKIVGAQGKSAKLVVNDSTTYTIALDSDGDRIFETDLGTFYWETGESAGSSGGSYF